MIDDGTGGDAVARDGIYSATIPGQPAGTTVAFYIQAADRYSPPATNRFPAGAPAHECLVRFGDTTPFGSFGTYHFWLTQSNINAWTTRNRLGDEPLDFTVVSGNQRVIYATGAGRRGPLRRECLEGELQYSRWPPRQHPVRLRPQTAQERLPAGGFLAQMGHPRQCGRQ